LEAPVGLGRLFGEEGGRHPEGEDAVFYLLAEAVEFGLLVGVVGDPGGVCER
jgi:hypothetical protein